MTPIATSRRFQILEYIHTVQIRLPSRTASGGYWTGAGRRDMGAICVRGAEKGLSGMLQGCRAFINAPQDRSHDTVHSEFAVLSVCINVYLVQATKVEIILALQLLLRKEN